MCSIDPKCPEQHYPERGPKTPDFCRLMTKISVPSLLLYVLVIFVTMDALTEARIIQGSIKRCEEEGEEVFEPGISTDPCITCVCLRREVNCYRRTCPAIEGCHVIPFDKPASECCETCQGCVYRRQQYSSGQEWADTRNVCRVHKCVAGVVTTSVQQCHVTCKNPRLITGKCCPLCEGCSMAGVDYREGETFPSPLDACAVCQCQNGSISCKKPTCPVQNCPDDYMYTPPGECCPLCRGSRQVYLPPGGACLFRRQVYDAGDVVALDNCTRCSCVSGTVVCDRISCPILDCATEDILAPGALSTSGAVTTSAEHRCCSRCVQPKRRCKLYGKKYLHGAVWRHDVCTHCFCEDGTVRCQTESCGNHIDCPNNTRLKMQPGKCCPQCVDDGALCTVFGDPHYRSFDGRIYNFQGTCDYTLTQTCDSGDIIVIVRNDARLTDQYAWTKSVRIHVAGSKIYFLQKNRVKVNQKRVKLPYVSRRGKFSVVSVGRSVALKTPLGIKVTWDGDSYLEVYVPPEFKNKMCGLCGNYNNDKSDDFLGRDGILHLDVNDFGHSWVAPGKRCKIDSGTSGGHRQNPCVLDPEKRRQATEQCGNLYKPEFEKCHAEGETHSYYSSCMTDVCECPDEEQCFCESIIAFTRACAQKGIPDLHQHLPFVCKVASCPKRAEWSECASPCVATCDDPMGNNGGIDESCSFQSCSPGCQCPAGKVLHENKCIRTSKCPNRANEVTKEKREKRKKKKYTNPLDFLIED